MNNFASKGALYVKMKMGKTRSKTGLTGGKPGRKMWVSLMTTLGISAAMYALRKYQNGKILRPVENMMDNIKPKGQNMMMAVNNSITEFSQEFVGNMRGNKQNKR